MSGIPVYTKAPINAATANGTTTPQTAAAAPTQGMKVRPSANTASTTAHPSSLTSYPAAQPGAPAMPAPTSAVQRYAPVQPSPITKAGYDELSAPQPGAFPIPANSVRSGLAPPPKAGETFKPPHHIAVAQSYPPQMTIPPPNTPYGAQLPSSSTSTTTTSSSAYPIPLSPDDYGASRRSLEHPPGYVQNAYASDLSADQRRVQDTPNTLGTGIYNPDRSNSTAAFGVGADSVWNTTKEWALTAGRKLSEAESELWKRVNGEK